MGQKNDSLNKCDNKKRAVVFKITDYDFDKDERSEKFKDYDPILCEKCNKEFGESGELGYHCNNCYEKETNKEERNRMLYVKNVMNRTQENLGVRTVMLNGFNKIFPIGLAEINLLTVSFKKLN